jgi:hypothetical protein
MTTKRQFVNQAFEEIGLASYVYDLTPEQLTSAVTKLDSMMATWNAKGIRLGYPLVSNPDQSDIESDTFVPDSAFEAITTNLAIRLAPSYGKTVSQDTKAIAKDAFNTLLSRAAVPPQMQLPDSMPLGAGNRLYDNPFTPPPVDPLTAGPDSVITF